MGDKVLHHFSTRFSLHIQENDETDLRPVFTEDGITYVYIKVRIVLLTRSLDFLK